MAIQSSKFSKKNDILDTLCRKVQGYNTLYPDTDNRRAKMFTFIAKRLRGAKGFGSMNSAEDFEKLLKKIDTLEFGDIASFDEYLQKIK